MLIKLSDPQFNEFILFFMGTPAFWKDYHVVFTSLWFLCVTLCSDFPAVMSCLWEIFIDSPLRQTPERLLETSKKSLLSCDVLKTSLGHLRKDGVYVTSLRRLKHLSKSMSILWRILDVSQISLASIRNFSEIPYRYNFVRFLSSYCNIW